MDELYYLETTRKGEIELYEKDGTFYDHDIRDLLVATFYDYEEAEKICKILNNHFMKTS